MTETQKGIPVDFSVVSQPYTVLEHLDTVKERAATIKQAADTLRLTIVGEEDKPRKVSIHQFVDLGYYTLHMESELHGPQDAAGMYEGNQDLHEDIKDRQFILPSPKEWPWLQTLFDVFDAAGYNPTHIRVNLVPFTRNDPDTPQVYKETQDGKITMEEVDIISRACGNYSFHDDRANGILAFTLPGLTEEEADDLVDKLNAIRPADSPEGKADWYLGDRNEEYVHCN